MQIDFSGIYAPEAVTGIRTESGVLPALGWLPDNGRPGGPPMATSSAQNYAQSLPRISVNPYPGTIGWVQQLLPLMDIWRFGMGITRIPYGPYRGGETVTEQGGMEFGINSAPMALPQIGG